jgi:hypothetical protein
MELLVNRSIDTTSFPFIQGSIPYQIIETGERSLVCEHTPEAYVVDTELDWTKSIEIKIRSDCDGNTLNKPKPILDFDNNTVLVFFWGQKPNSGNTISILKVESNPTNNSISITLRFQNGILDALSYPYIIATIPKVSSCRFLFLEDK